MIKPILKSDQTRHSALKSKAKAQKKEAKEEKLKAATKERGKVSPRLRSMIMDRDKFRCILCNRNAADGVVLVVDHIVPIAAGGKTLEENLVTLCQPCNAGKGARQLDMLRATGHAIKPTQETSK